MNHPNMSSDALLFVNQFWGHSWTLYVQVKVLLLVGWVWNVNALLLWLLTVVVNSRVSMKIFYCTFWRMKNGKIWMNLSWENISFRRLLPFLKMIAIVKALDGRWEQHIFIRRRIHGRTKIRSIIIMKKKRRRRPFIWPLQMLFFLLLLGCLLSEQLVLFSVCSISFFHFFIISVWNEAFTANFLQNWALFICPRSVDGNAPH